MLKNTLSKFVTKHIPITLDRFSTHHRRDLPNHQQHVYGNRKASFCYNYPEQKASLYQNIRFAFTSRQTLSVDDIIALELDAVWAYRAGNLDESLDKFRTALEARKRIWETENSQDFLKLYIDIGRILAIKNKFEDAYEHLKRAIEISDNLLEDKPLQCFEALNLLGTICHDRLEKPEEALEHHLKALALCLKNPDLKRQEIACRYNLMASYLKIERPEDAVREGLKAKEMLQELDKMDLGSIKLFLYNNFLLARVYGRLNQPDNAEKVYLEALNVWQLLGIESYDMVSPTTVLNLLYDICSRYHAQGKVDQSINYIFKVLKALNGIFGEEHAIIMYSHQILSVTLYMKNDFERATISAEKALEISKKTLGLHDDYTDEIIDFLKILYIKQSLIKKALSLIREQYNTFLEKDCKDPQREIRLLHEIGYMLVILCDKGFEEPLKKAIRLTEAVPNYPTKELLSIRENLAKGYEMRTKWKKALEIHDGSAEKILARFEKDSEEYKLVEELIENVNSN